jgi:hypothetical protein
MGNSGSSEIMGVYPAIFLLLLVVGYIIWVQMSSDTPPTPTNPAAVEIPVTQPPSQGGTPPWWPFR